MNILYGVQGTGHGHISRAKELLPELSRHASVDVLVSGYACQLDLGDPVTYRKHGISLSYDYTGGVSILETLKDLRPVRFITDVHSVPLGNYDLVISDYEPVTAWAAKMAGVPSLALSHQAAFLSPKTPRPHKKTIFAEAVLQHFAPADRALGFHFRKYDHFIKPPIIRSEIRALKSAIENQNHISVYLPAYHHRKLLQILRPITNVDWHIFAPSAAAYRSHGHIHINPVSNKGFLDSFKCSKGVLTSAGFETSAEAMYLHKKLMVVPIRNQYEQMCNAVALGQMGVQVQEKLADSEEQITQWLEEDHHIEIQEIADPVSIVSEILKPGSDLESKKRKKTVQKDRRFSLSY